MTNARMTMTNDRSKTNDFQSIFIVRNSFIEQMGSELPLKNGHAFDRQKETKCQ